MHDFQIMDNIYLFPHRLIKICSKCGVVYEFSARLKDPKITQIPLDSTGDDIKIFSWNLLPIEIEDVEGLKESICKG